MKADINMQEFSLFGGPLQRLGRRLGLVRGSNSFGLGVALGLLAWGVIALLVLLQGLGDRAFSLNVIGIHIRFLVAIPLFFLCETWVAPRMAEFTRDIVRSGVVPESERLALDGAIRRVGRMRDPWVMEICFLVVVVVFALITPFLNLPGKTGNWEMLMAETGGRVSPVLGWYMWFCIPLFRFLMLRWLWHLGLWCYFLWKVKSLDLHLVPTHPDGAAGLGYLEIVQEHFGALAFAISAVMAASFAEDIVSGRMNFETLYLLIPMVLVLVLGLFIGPLLVFIPKLWECRITGWSEYMGMAFRYVSAFDKKWIRDEAATGESQLGTGDLQSLADLNNSVSIVRGMRCVPASPRLANVLAVCAIIPLVPLIFLKYPLADLMAKMFQTLTGL
ncbi:MAG: hypothetical protein WCS52_09865 [bacterium]